jgi:CHAT domain-containing protein
MLAPGRRVLHIATHGFVATLPPTPKMTLRDDALSENPCPDALESPLVKSGLALAGANHPPDEMEGLDGLLSGEEVATLDLSGVELTVLSACETGLGPVRSGEGVFNLCRAFELAGCSDVIATLWQVDDRATQEWMRAFYRAYSHDWQAAAAIREASRRVISDRRAAGRCTHPFFWGAFAGIRSAE